VAPASSLHANAASQSLDLALELLLEAAGEAAPSWNGAARFATEVRELTTQAAGRIPASEPHECELVVVERMAVETARLAHTLARDCRAARVSAVAAAILAESAARIAVEVISEQLPWSPVERVSRQARQLIEIESAQRRVDKAARLVLERGPTARVERISTSPEPR
jgi:hypothetical protein